MLLRFPENDNDRKVWVSKRHCPFWTCTVPSHTVQVLMLLLEAQENTNFTAKNSLLRARKQNRLRRWLVDPRGLDMTKHGHDFISLSSLKFT